MNEENDTHENQAVTTSFVVVINWERVGKSPTFHKLGWVVVVIN